MKRADLQIMSTDQLVWRFAAIALEQDEAALADDLRRVNRLFWELEAIEGELRARPRDERRALLALYDHPNAQVRLKAAEATLAVAPEASLRMLHIIADSKEYPQAGDAGMSLYNLKRGIFKPT